MHLNDIAPAKYEAGWNVDFLSAIEEVKPENGMRGSIIPTVVPIKENKWPTPMSFINTNRQRAVVNIHNANVSLIPASSTSSSEFYERAWGLGDAEREYMHAHNFFEETEKINVIASRGKCAVYNPATKQFNQWTRGDGHLGGKKTGPGVRPVWDGKLMLFEDQNDSVQNIY